MGAPQTLPANFDGWDKGAPTSLPADFNQWDQPKSAAPPEKSTLGKVWDAINTPVADFALPKGVKTADLLKAAAFEKLGLGPYMPGINDFDTKANEHFGESPTKDAIKSFIFGATKDASNMVAGATSPLSLGMAGAGAASQAGGAIGTLGKAATAIGGAGMAGKGVSDISNAQGQSPEAWQQRLSGGAELAGGAASAGPAIGNLAGKAALLGRTPQEAYQSALKPSTTIPPARVARMVNTGLTEGIPVSPAGVEKLGSLIDDVNNKIAATIGDGKGVTIDPQAVAQRADQVTPKFANQVNPTADLQAIADSKQEFLSNNKNPIPAADAQAMKQGTYQQLSTKAYGELKSASIESQKALARGLKEELANAFPELNDLNAQDSKLYDLQPVLQKAIQREANHQLGGIGTPITAGAAKAVTGSNTAAAIAGVMKAIVDNPNVKSRLAIALSKSGTTLPAANAKIAAYSAALASAASNNADANQADQSPSQ